MMTTETNSLDCRYFSADVVDREPLLQVAASRRRRRRFREALLASTEMPHRCRHCPPRRWQALDARCARLAGRDWPGSGESRCTATHTRRCSCSCFTEDEEDDEDGGGGGGGLEEPVWRAAAAAVAVPTVGRVPWT